MDWRDPREDARRVTTANDAVCLSDSLVLDASERRIRGLVMPPLLAGEFKLLSYLGAHSQTWHSSYHLSVRVYHREDPAARQLVWKYASTLRKKLAAVQPNLIELCRRRGYRCRQGLQVVGEECAAPGPLHAVVR